MVAHTKSHAGNDFIKLGKINSGKYKGEIRPIEHYVNNTTGKFVFQAGVKAWKIVPPEDCVDKGDIKCRVCKKVVVKFSRERHGLTVRQQIFAVVRFKNHEGKCKGGKNR